MNGKAKWVQVGWMAGALLPLLAGVAGAINPTMPQTNQPNQQDEQVATSPTPDQTAGFQPKLDRAKDLIGAKVVNDKGERLGTVADIVLTPGRDAISYVALSHGGTWGVGEKYFAVPWSQFGVRAGEKERLLVLNNVAKEDLDKAKGFDKDHWPTVARENWLGTERDINRSPAGTTSESPAMRLLAYQENPENRGVTDEIGDQGLFTAPVSGEYADPEEVMTTEPPAAGDQSAQAVEPGRGSSPNTGGSEVVTPGNEASNIEHLRLSKLLGTRVRNLQNEDLGKLDNAMIDVHQGKLAYGIVAIRSGFLGLNKDYVAVPWSALDLAGQPGIARLDADKQTLTAIAFSRDNFPNLEDPQYSRQLYERFHATPYWEALGFVPGQDNQNGNPPASGTTAPQSAAPQRIADKHAPAYNPNAVETIHGTVKSVTTHRIKGTTTEELRLSITTDAGKTVMIHVGPRSYVDRQNISFHPGDAVTITGSVAKAAKVGRHEVLVASQIQTADKTLNLRGKDGKPLWNLDQSKSPRAAPRSSGQMQNSYEF
jgi:sporulation protein YlmC with PRC-barrel domain